MNDIPTTESELAPGVAIVGMAGRFPGAADVRALWDVLCAGRETISFFTEDELDPSIPAEERADPKYVRARGVLDDADKFDAAFFGIHSRQADLMDPQQRVFLELAWAAMEDAGRVPGQFAGMVGVYAGVGNNTYFSTSIHGRRRLIAAVGEFPTMLANEKDYVATRTAYHLNLTGPGISLNTACSTSLVAVIQAYYSLLSFQCDMALAGGVSIQVPQRSGYLCQEGDIYSTDGHCHPFDAAGNGTVFSNGGGVVVLRRVEDAVRDGDRIYAVIRGVGLNNDGMGKVSFGAPSVKGQAGAISMALAQANIAPDAVSYIETHGTGTQLGDPIEIEALTQAFREKTARRQFCAVGSVKGNVGHLTAASGVTGLIKTCLALQHRMLPPTINHNAPNPQIDFAASPFFVNRELKAWESDGPRVAGVSSFGVGGTNAHVVLEEGPAAGAAAAPSRPWQVLVLSAKTPAALTRAGANLRARLEAEPALNLADVAYTLQVGRERFPHRRFAVGRDAAEAAAALAGSDPLRTGARHVEQRHPAVVFLFPGQGSQYVNMGRDLYAQEPVFRAAIDRCCDLLKPHLGLNLRETLYPAGDAAVAEAALEQTQLAQPAIFTLAYALAAQWRAWGVVPVAMIGHSIGEFVCGCLAGVFTLEDALMLVAARGRLMQAMPAGAMLSVRKPVADVEPLLGRDLSIAAINGPGLCVVSGPQEAVAALEARLEADGVRCKRLRTSHAFHSPMMDPVVPAFAACLRGVRLSAPQTPYLSTATASWITPAEATSADYWARHLRATVRFADAVRALWQEHPQHVLLEVGPGTTAATLARQQAADPLKQVAVSSLGQSGQADDDAPALMRALGALWAADVEVPWEQVHAGTRRQRIALPTYSFERTRHWLEALAPDVAGADEDPARAGGVPAAAGAATPEGGRDSKAALRHLLEEASGLDLAGAPDSATLLDMGFDSLSLTQLALSLRRAFGIDVTFRQLLEQYATLDALAVVVEAHKPVVAAAKASASPAGEERAVALEAAAPAAKAKTFGAGARIDLSAGQTLTPAQEQSLQAFMEAYVRRTARSKALTQQNRAQLADPRVVSGFRPRLKEIIYPIVVDRSEGSRLWDVDGHAYIDLTCGFGSNFFGNRAPFLVEAIQAQAARGYEIGPQHPLAGEVAALFCELTGMERAAFCNTGSEAVLGAMRLARTVTGRLKIAVFAGAYHGILDEVIVRGGKGGKPLPAAPGIPPSAVENLVVLEYGSPAALATLRACAGELAAVLVEPVQSRRPGLQPREFLQAVRAITAEAGTALIMDEVITGFRIHQGGAQAYFGVRGDLATYGKVVGGGMPIGVIGGTRRFMDALDGGHWQFGDDSFPAVGVTYFAGTFVRHPLTLAAARAALQHLKAGGPGLQEALNQRTAAFTAALTAAFVRRGMPLRVDHCGSLFKIMGTDDVPQGDLLYAWLRHHGLHIWDHRPCFLTLAHTDADLAEALAAFERALDAVQAAGFLAPAPAAVAVVPGDVPCTAAQREIWLSVRMGGRDANLAFNESVSVQVRGALDPAVLRDAAQAAVDRHESLRATFSADGARMRIAETMPVTLATEDLSGLAPAARAARLRALMDAEVEEPFDLEHGPLIRFRLLTLGAEEAQVVITAHHIICDGWAIDVLVKDLGALYGARRRGVAAALPPADRFSAYAREREEFGESAEAAAVDAYWLERFAGALPVLELPADCPRPSRRTFRGGRVDLALDEELVVALRQAGARLGCSLVNMLLAGFDAWLYRVTGQTDLVVGLPAAGQSASGCEQLVGHCVNLLPLRVAVEPAASFDALARCVRGVLLDAYEHQHFTFGRLLERLRLPRDPSRIPLLPVAFNIDQGIAVEGFAFDGMPTTFTSNPRHFENFELFLNAMPEGRTLVLQANHNADLYTRETVLGWLHSLVALLRAVARDATAAVHSLPLLEADERRRVLVEWNATRSDYPREAGIARLFEEQAAKTPSAVALAVVRDAEAGAPVVTVTYDELNRRANRLARVLMARGLKAEEPVGLAAERSADAVVGLLAILKAGGVYLPLDPGWPRARLAFMLQDTEAKLVLADESAARQLPPVGGATLPLAATIVAPGVDDGNLPDAGGGERLAYLMYTSGSTGTPKGVAVTQRGVVRLVRGTNFMELGSGTAMLQFAPLAFDASTLEIWGPLLNGGRVVVPPPGVLTTAELGRVVRTQGVNALWLSAELFRLMVEERLDDLRGVRQLLAGGDVLAVGAVERVLEALPECRLINGYGPTENTTFTCCYDITRGRVTRPSVPIGRPVANTTVYLLDASMQPVPVGVPGELYTGGDGVARSYWRRPELTEAAFVADPFGGVEGGRLYRTGDLARYRPDGTIEFLGRRDRQLKLRGFRVEPGEIEAALERVDGIAQAVVSVWEPRPGDRRLAAHVVPGAGARVSASAVREALRRLLPAHMIPQHVVELAAMPMTPTGKIDRARLPAPTEPGRGAVAADDAPRGAMETRLAAVWCEVLGVAQVRAVDNFFDLGGHSLLAIRAVERIRVATGVEVSPNDILFSTLRQLAAAVEKAAVAT